MKKFRFVPVLLVLSALFMFSACEEDEILRDDCEGCSQVILSDED